MCKPILTIKGVTYHLFENLTHMYSIVTLFKTSVGTRDDTTYCMFGVFHRERWKCISYAEVWGGKETFMPWFLVEGWVRTYFKGIIHLSTQIAK